MECKPSNESYCNHAVLEMFVIQRNEQRPDIFCLSKVLIEPLV